MVWWFIIPFCWQGEIIESRGYPLEVHHVVTEDGYILEMKRIPGSKKCNQKSANGLRKKPVFLQHGMMSGDHVYLLNSNENALGKFTITFKSFNPGRWLVVNTNQLHLVMIIIIFNRLELVDKDFKIYGIYQLIFWRIGVSTCGWVIHVEPPTLVSMWNSAPMRKPSGSIRKSE